MSFTGKQRRIFKFFDGQRQRGMDPLEIDVAKDALDLDWKDLFSQVRLGYAAAAEAQKAIAAAGDGEVDLKPFTDNIKSGNIAEKAIGEAARKVFGLKEYDIDPNSGTETGLSTEECCHVLQDFLTWREELRNFTEPPQTSPQSTDGTAAATASGTAST